MKIAGTEVEVVSNPYSTSSAPIDNEYFDKTKSLLVKGSWNEGIGEYILENQIKGLYLNYTKNFNCKNFDFLLNLSGLETLNIIYTPVNSLSPIESIDTLKSLSISCHWKNKLDLGSLQKLERCFIGYDNGAESVFECKSLRYLYIDNFKVKSFQNLKNLNDIEFLTIGNSTFNESKLLGELDMLRKLVLLNCRQLNNLEGIEKLNNLEWLTIDGSKKINSINEVSSLLNLKVLQLSNNKEIESLSPIKNLNKLKALSFNGDTIIRDGDFNLLENLKYLSLVGFVGRRHYSHKPTKTWNWKSYHSNEPAVIAK